jgi:hypothetical protein
MKIQRRTAAGTEGIRLSRPYYQYLDSLIFDCAPRASRENRIIPDDLKSRGNGGESAHPAAKIEG